jgi:hypothetical protein
MDHDFSDSDIGYEYLSGEGNELGLLFDDDNCYFRKRDVIAMAEALGLIVVEVS